MQKNGALKSYVYDMRWTLCLELDYRKLKEGFLITTPHLKISKTFSILGRVFKELRLDFKSLQICCHWINI